MKRLEDEGEGSEDLAKEYEKGIEERVRSRFAAGVLKVKRIHPSGGQSL